MDNLNDLKAIWRSGPAPQLPGAAAVKSTIQSFQRQRVRKKWFIIILATFLGVLIAFAAITEGSHFWTTWVGNTLIVIGCAWLAFTNVRSLKRFNQLDDCTNREFLAFLEKTRQNQHYYYRRTQAVIMLFTSVGLLFTLYEPSTRRPQWTAALFIGCVCYLLIIWFVLRPRMARRNRAKLAKLTDHFKKLTEQLEENE